MPPKYRLLKKKRKPPHPGRVPRLTLGFPKSRLAKLRYVDQVRLEPGLASQLTHSFRANSLFDPDYSGVGHQPMYFDQFSALYNHYTVLGSKISIRVLPEESTMTAAPYDIYVGVLLDDDVASIPTGTAMMEQKLCKWRYMPGITNGGTRARHLSTTYSAKKFHGVKDVVDNDRLQAAITANPAEVAFFNVFAGSFQGNPQTVSMIVTIEYIARFSELKTITQS